MKRHKTYKSLFETIKKEVKEKILLRKTGEV